MRKLFALRERGRQPDMLGRVVQLPVNVYSPLDPANCNLRELPVAEAFGLMWVHPTATASLDIRSYLGDIADDLEHFNIGQLISYTKTMVVKQAA